MVCSLKWNKVDSGLLGITHRDAKDLGLPMKISHLLLPIATSSVSVFPWASLPLQSTQCSSSGMAFYILLPTNTQQQGTMWVLLPCNDFAQDVDQIPWGLLKWHWGYNCVEASQARPFAVNVRSMMQENQVIMCKQSDRSPFSLYCLDWLNQTPVWNLPNHANH